MSRVAADLDVVDPLLLEVEVVVALSQPTLWSEVHGEEHDGEVHGEEHGKLLTRSGPGALTKFKIPVNRESRGADCRA